MRRSEDPGVERLPGEREESETAAGPRASHRLGLTSASRPKGAAVPSPFSEEGRLGDG